MACQEYRESACPGTNRDVITDDGINYRGKGKERSIIPALASSLEKRNETNVASKSVGRAIIAWLANGIVADSDGAKSMAFSRADLRIHCFPSMFSISDLARRISRRRCVNYSLRIGPVGVKLANNFTSP